ncbi:MAG: dUTP diphosphatase [bacterium]
MLEEIIIERITATAKLPTRGHYNDAGLDIYADETVTLQPGQNKNIKTGLKMAIPDNYTALVWDKGGIARNGIHTLAGVIDSGYRGEVGIEMINLTKQDYEITAGQKIAQILIQPVSLCNIKEGQIDDQTSRGDGKHGSTGFF